jgi:hypothetical protein
LKIKFPIIVDVEEIIGRIYSELSSQFSLCFYKTQEDKILNLLKQKNITEASKAIDDMRKSLSDLDVVLRTYYTSLLDYQKLLIQLEEEKNKEVIEDTTNEQI